MLLKSAAYSSYLLYLALSDNFQFTFVVLPLLMMFIDRRLTPWLLLACFCFDVDWSMSIATPFEFTNVFLRSQTSSYWMAPLLAVTALVCLVAMAKMLAFVRSKTKILTLPFMLLSIVFIIEGFRWSSYQSGLTAFSFATVLSLIAKKYWLHFLLALEYQYASKTLSLKQTVEGLLVPMMFRESFKLNQYETDRNQGIKIGGLMAAMTSIAILIYNQSMYQLTGLLTPTVIPNSYSLNFICHSSLTTLAAPETFSKSFLFGCFLANDVLRGIIKHILIDGMVIVIPTIMMGWRFSLPFSNFMAAKNWPGFLFRLFYYYALIIYRIFTVEFYHLIQRLFKKRAQWQLPLATFLGVFVGGYCFHAFKDFVYIQQFSRESIFKTLFSLNSFTYFFTIALFCAFAEIRRRKNTLKLQWYYLINAFYLIVFLILRSFFSAYFHQMSFSTKLMLLMKTFF